MAYGVWRIENRSDGLAIILSLDLLFSDSVRRMYMHRHIFRTTPSLEPCSFFDIKNILMPNLNIHVDLAYPKAIVQVNTRTFRPIILLGKTVEKPTEWFMLKWLRRCLLIRS